MTPPDANSKDRISSPAAQVEAIGKLALAVSGSLYLIGVLVTNLYLTRWGVIDFSIVKLRFVLTGATFLITNALLYMPIYGVWRLGLLFFGRRTTARQVLAQAAIVLSLLIVLFLALGWAFIVYFLRFDYSPQSSFFVTDWPALLVLLPMLPAIALAHAAATIGFLRRTRIRGWYALILLVAWLINLHVYATEMHARIGPQFGGGKPRFATLVLEDTTIAALPEELRPPETHTTVSWQIIHERDDDYICAVFNPATLALNILTIPRTAVRLVTVDERHVYDRSVEDAKFGAVFAAGEDVWTTLLGLIRADLSTDDLARALNLHPNDVQNFLLILRMVEDEQAGNMTSRESLARYELEWPEAARLVQFLRSDALDGH